jgi:hypothetical protein
MPIVTGANVFGGLPRRPPNRYRGRAAAVYAVDAGGAIYLTGPELLSPGRESFVQTAPVREPWPVEAWDGSESGHAVDHAVPLGSALPQINERLRNRGSRVALVNDNGSRIAIAEVREYTFRAVDPGRSLTVTGPDGGDLKFVLTPDSRLPTTLTPGQKVVVETDGRGNVVRVR